MWQLASMSSNLRSSRFVIKCNYCTDESSDWLEYIGHLHGDHMPGEADENVNDSEHEVDVYEICDKCDSTGDNATASSESSKAGLVSECKHNDGGSGVMIEEYLDIECSFADGGTNDGNYEDSEGDVIDDLDLEDVTTTSAAIGNAVKLSFPASNKRFFQLRTTPVNIMMKFIDILRGNPLQWDNEHPDYSNREKRKKSSFQLSQQIKRHFNINITARAAGCSARALLRWFQREHRRFLSCKLNDTQFVCYRSEYFEKLLQFLPSNQLHAVACDKCQRSFKSEHLLLSHKHKYHKGQAPFTCRYCERAFVHPSSLKLHENRHTKIDLWPCGECLYQSPSKADYLKHLASHSPAQPYKCDICGLAYKTSTNLSVHKKSHRLPEYECNICRKKFYEKYRYKRHRWQHNENDLNSLNTFNCSLCGRRFTCHQTLLKHQVVHMLENYNLDGDGTTDVPQNVKEELQLYYCDYCSLEFINNEAFGTHMTLKHAVDIN